MRPLLSRRGLFCGALAALVSRAVPDDVARFDRPVVLRFGVEPGGGGSWVVTGVDRAKGVITVASGSPVAITGSDYLFRRAEL